MKYALYTVVLAIAGAVFLTFSGCSTDQPGATDTLGSYSTNVAATPDKVTTAASKACSDLNLQNINSNGTSVDGKVTANTADGTAVVIDIAQSGDNVSKVTIRVGTTGDQSISQQLVDRIKSHLSLL
jgi:uncharacterized protein DUF3568